MCLLQLTGKQRISLKKLQPYAHILWNSLPPDIQSSSPLTDL